jgi:hypothetical protein
LFPAGVKIPRVADLYIYVQMPFSFYCVTVKDLFFFSQAAAPLFCKNGMYGNGIKP